MRLNNKGNTLVTLLVAFLIISILASTAFHLASINFSIDKNNLELNKAIYKAEVALDYIRAGVESDCAEIMKDKYNLVLESYSYIPYQERNDLFKSLYKEGLEDIYNSFTIKTTLKDYLTAENKINLASEEGKAGYYLYDTVDVISDTHKITLKDIKLTYTERNSSYSATVRTDIVINLADVFNEEFEAVNHNSEYGEYIIVADNQFKQDTSGNVDLYGSIYAGNGGIVIGGSASSVNVNMSGKSIHSRGDIHVSNGATLNLNNTTDDVAHNVYVNNIEVGKSLAGITSGATININGIVNVADDLVINSDDAHVTMSGEYYGYGDFKYNYSAEGNIMKDEDKESSAIIINSKNTYLSTENLSRLMLAGNANINPFKNTGSASGNKVVTSESLTSKFMQIAYLIPSECFSNGVNPMQYTGSAVEIDYSVSKSNGGMDLLNPDYCIDTVNPPIVITVPYQGNKTLEYYYLRFKSEEGQKRYLNDYAILYNNYLANRAEIISGDSEIISNTDYTHFITSNNILDYSKNADGDIIISLVGYNASEEYISAENKRLTSEAISKNSTLLYNQASELTQSLVETVVDTELIRNNDEYSYYTLDDFESVNMDSDVKDIVRDIKSRGLLEYDIVICKGDYVVPTDFRAGLIVALGNVTLGHNFIGTIISGNDVIVHSGADIRNETENGENCPFTWITSEYEDASSIREYFYTLKDDNKKSLSLTDIKNTIKFENWVVY